MSVEGGPSPDDPVTFGVLGVADIAVAKVVPAMQTTTTSRVDAIASRSAERAADAARRLGLARSHGSYADLLADPDLEAVYIPLPNHLHRDWTIAALEAGKHVLCEKPLALTAAQAREMAGVADRCRRLLVEAFMYRLHPMWREAKRLVEASAIGEVMAVRTVFSYHNDDPSDIRNVAAFGGGALYDVGCYAVDVSRWLFGAEPDDVRATVRADPASGTDVVTSALLDFGGRHATFVCSTRMEPDQQVEILGSEGRMVIEIPFNIPPDRPTRILVVAGGDPPVAPATEVVEVATADPYATQADAFSLAVRTAAEPPVPLADSVANLEVIEAVFAAAGHRPGVRGRSGR